ncbi:MAG: cupin domain-containing protein [Bacteroidales bacterium]|nr:cupin domain-containing protein [Bacteroidales bacterium]
MKISKKNIFDKPLSGGDKQEIFEELIKTNDFFVERIYTNKAFEQPGKWYDQKKDEWVLLLQGKADLEFAENEIVQLNAGDYIFIPAHQKHRIIYSSVEPKCIWLAVFGDLK